jgi:hypothetical protein
MPTAAAIAIIPPTATRRGERSDDAKGINPDWLDETIQA